MKFSLRYFFTILMLAFAAHADILADLKVKKCQVRLDGNIITPRLGEYGQAVYEDDNVSGLTVYVYPNPDETVNLTIVKIASPVSINARSLSIATKNTQFGSIEIFESNLCFLDGK
ncbi:MAG: hypothetical protein H7328_12650 [Bdellovibrio sp.]|nr:hypothetical protein [Bdellovibrio sp.]